MRKSLLFKLIIVNAIILGFVLNFLALTLAIWFRGNFFNEKRTQFKKIGEYISRTIDAGSFKGGLADQSYDSTKYHTCAHLILASLQKMFDKAKTKIYN